MNLKNIHIGKLINTLVVERDIDITRICNFMKCTETEIKRMYQEKSLDTEILLKWSKLLEYDFYRLYSQHLILYAPVKSIYNHKKNCSLPQFRKNIYTKEIIDFILDQITTGRITKKETIQRYRIPKTTLYKWIEKNK